jgi:hypothetical protein
VAVGVTADMLADKDWIWHAAQNHSSSIVGNRRRFKAQNVRSKSLESNDTKRLRSGYDAREARFLQAPYHTLGRAGATLAVWIADVVK